MTDQQTPRSQKSSANLPHSSVPLQDAYDVIIVGGGIVGASAAYHAAESGAHTLLIDRQDPGRATSAGAGIMAPSLSVGYSEPWFRFALESVAFYTPLLEQLRALGADETGFDVCGMLLVAATGDEVERFAAAREQVLARRGTQGFATADELYEVSATEAQTLFPALADVHGALYYRNAARIDGRLMNRALLHGAQAHGAHVLNASVQTLHVQNGRITGVRLPEMTIHSDAVIVAGGAWSHGLGQPLGLSIPVEPQRGQILHLDLPETDTSAWPIVNAFHGHYIVCWPGPDGGGRVVVGATRETGSGYDVHTTAAGIREVLDEALRVAPGLAGARLHEIRIGLRPHSVDGLPVLGLAPEHPGLVLATGHGPTGLQLGPYSGKIATDLALDGKTAADTTPFQIERFA